MLWNSLHMGVSLQVLGLGIFATVCIDIWATFANKILKFPRTNWAMVGRWVGHIPGGKFIHHPVSASAPVKNEALIGWVFHYLIGIFYAAVYVVYVSIALNNVPTFMSALIFGWITLLSPWFIMQPGLGLGICAVKAPRPNLVRLQNLIIHSVFGIALYYGWVVVNRII